MPAAASVEKMYPDRRDRPSDPRTAFSRNSGCSPRSLGESRGLLSRAASLLSSPSEALPNVQAFSASANVPF